MKKLIAAVLAVLLFTLNSALAQEIPGPEGVWYAEDHGRILKLTFVEDGGYTLSATGTKDEVQGSWEMEEAYVILDGDSALPLTFPGESLYNTDSGLFFRKEPPEVYEPAPLKKAEAVFTDVEGTKVSSAFTGAWKSAYILMGGAVMPASAFADHTILYFEGFRVAILNDYLGKIIADFLPADDSLLLEEEGISFRIQLQEDDMVRFTVRTDEEEMVYVMAPYMTEVF